MTDDMLEVREEWLTLAKEHDRRVREIERQWKGVWIEMADLCITVRDNREWEMLGFHSWNAWLMDAAPCSRSMAYLAIGIREELKEFTTEDLKAIPLGNAEILKSLPRSIRSREDVVDEAKRHPPREFRSRAILASPDSHLEANHTWKIKFTSSQAKRVQAAIDAIGLLEEIEDPAGAIEAICADYMLSHQQELEEICSSKSTNQTSSAVFAATAGSAL